MKIAIVYYSLTGNIEYVVNYISERIKVDTIKLVPKKEYPNKGLKKFLWGGKSAIMSETPELEEYKFDADKYDYIILATPVWASRFAPPLRTFINDNIEKLKTKTIATIVSYSGGGAKEAINRIRELLGIEDIDKELILIDPKDKNTEEKEKEIDSFIDYLSKISH